MRGWMTRRVTSGSRPAFWPMWRAERSCATSAIPLRVGSGRSRRRCRLRAPSFRALELSGWPAGGRALLARLAVDEARGGIVAHPMTVVGPHGAVRLSV